MSAPTVVLLVAGGVLAWLAMWAGVVSLIGLVAWRPLADRYPAGRWPEGEGLAFTWRSGSVGLANYNASLNAVLTEEGLYLRPLRVFAFQHPPMRIPWGAIERTSRGVFGGVKLHLPDGALVLRGRLGRVVEEAVAAARGGAA